MARAPGIPRAERLPELGQALRWRRRDLGLQQAQVAERIAASGISCHPKYIQQLERGATHPSGEPKYPSRPMFAQLLRVLGMREDELRELCEHRPWATAHRAAADASLRTQAPDGTTWSSPVALAAASVPPPEDAQAELERRFAAMSRLDQQALLAEARRRTPQLP